jgi:hypothetical protein
MTKYFSAVLILLFTASFIFAANLVPKKPAPPPHLAVIFDIFFKVEDDFESGNWNAALKATYKVDSTFRKMLPELNKQVLNALLEDFSAALSNLRHSLKNKDMRGAEEKFVEIESLFLTIMDNYEYKISPTMLLIDKYISVAEQALRKKNFGWVAEEMTEIGDFIYREESRLRNEGVPYEDIEKFKRAVREVRAAGEAKSSKKAKAGIRTLKALSARFLQLY